MHLAPCLIHGKCYIVIVIIILIIVKQKDHKVVELEQEGTLDPSGLVPSFF